MLKILREKLIWIAALGYFVDLFDLVLYGVVRVNSLQSLGYSKTEVFSVGATLLNIQMFGLLVGGFIWGMIGDRRGRREALFGSIFIYSLATFLNAYVHDFTGYATLRFLAGLGLAGELGAAITLISEVLPQKNRGMGSAFVASIGFIGAAVSSYVCQSVSWQNAYRIGGALGFLLLTARMSIKESSLFVESKREQSDSSQWGSLQTLFSSKNRRKIFGMAFLIGVPIWYVAGVLSYFSPEFARDLKITGEVTAGTTIMWAYLGSILGDIFCGLVSQWLQSRRKAVLIFMSVGALTAIFHPFFLQGASPNTFYAVRALIGFSNGFFAILIAWIAESFGTNLRATATTSLCNLIRASVIPLIWGFESLRPWVGLNGSSMIIGAISFAVALICAFKLPETFHRQLNFLETNSIH